jgi:hypothetical protein
VTWEALDAALEARARTAGKPPPFWWRDDDLEAPSPALTTLLDLRRRLRIPLAIATIPATAEAGLAETLGGETGVTILQHGYDHSNHAGPGEKKAELVLGRDGGRDAGSVLAELKQGRARLEGIFGQRFRPVLVPPWNRIDPEVISHLAAAGYEALSASRGRKPAAPVQGLPRVDCHIDVIDWRGSRGFIGTEAALAQAATALAEAEGTVGLLTHHLVMDPAAWDFVAVFVARVKARGGRWLDVAEAIA